jgi:hypothetical protein
MVGVARRRFRLHVCVGMADKPAELVFDDHILEKRAVVFLW